MGLLCTWLFAPSNFITSKISNLILNSTTFLCTFFKEYSNFYGSNIFRGFLLQISPFTTLPSTFSQEGRNYDQSCSRKKNQLTGEYISNEHHARSQGTKSQGINSEHRGRQVVLRRCICYSPSRWVLLSAVMLANKPSLFGNSHKNLRGDWSLFKRVLFVVVFVLCMHQRFNIVLKVTSMLSLHKMSWTTKDTYLLSDILSLYTYHI